MAIGESLLEAIELIQSDRQAGLEAVKRLAVAGDKSAILCLGLYLSEDSKTNDEAIPWLARAANFGSGDAAWNLAMIAREKNDPKAMRKWIDVAANLGEVDAIQVRSRGYEVDSVLKAIGK